MTSTVEGHLERSLTFRPKFFWQFWGKFFGNFGVSKFGPGQVKFFGDFSKNFFWQFWGVSKFGPGQGKFFVDFSKILWSSPSPLSTLGDGAARAARREYSVYGQPAGCRNEGRGERKMLTSTRLIPLVPRTFAQFFLAILGGILGNFRHFLGTKI